MGIKTIIVDDEQLAIDTLSWQIKEYCQGIEIVATFNNPLNALEYLKNTSIHLCFLDIDMPEMNGFDFLSLIQKRDFDVIFTTAYNEFAIKAFKVSAFDYLLKPIDEEELANTVVQYLQTASSKKDIESRLEVLIEQLTSKTEYSDKISMSTAEGIHIVEVDKIIRLESNSNYTQAYIEGKATILLSKSLKEVEQVLDPNRFVRVHQSHTIDISKVETYYRGSGGSVKMKNGDVVPVSKNKKNIVLSLLKL